MARGVHGRVIVGIMLVLIGLITFAQNYEPFEQFVPDFIYNWEIWFIVFGSLFLLLARNKTVGVVFIGIGLFNLFPELWPLIFVLIGAYILLGYNGRRLHRFGIGGGNSESEQNSSEILDQISIFGGGRKVFSSDNFKGGNIISIFGGSEVNLLNSKLADGENILEVTSIFGGSTVIVPQDWKIEVDVLPIFGGFSDKRRSDPNQVFDPSKQLIIKGVAIFGGGEVKTIF
jgi:predicted membrane protein